MHKLNESCLPSDLVLVLRSRKSGQSKLEASLRHLISVIHFQNTTSVVALCSPSWLRVGSSFGSSCSCSDLFCHSQKRRHRSLLEALGFPTGYTEVTCHQEGKSIVKGVVFGRHSRLSGSGRAEVGVGSRSSSFIFSQPLLASSCKCLVPHTARE